MIYSEKTVPTEWLANIKAIIKIDTSEEISIEELRRMLSELREAIMTTKREKENGVKMGHWVKEDIVLTSYPPQYQWHCSECGETVHGFSDGVLKDRCPNCGIKMEKENEMR